VGSAPEKLAVRAIQSLPVGFRAGLPMVPAF